MTRTKPMLWGALFGGIIGPTTVGFSLAFADALTPNPAFQGNELWRFPLVAVIYWGIPGSVVGCVFGPVLQRLRPAPRAFWSACFAIVAYVSTFLALGLTLGSHGIWPFLLASVVGTPPGAWLAIAGSGLVCGLIFPHSYLVTNAQPSVPNP